MSRLTLFNSPLMLGFDHIEQMMERLQKASGDGYPPYNIEQTSQYGLRITLAVAGFATDDLSVTVEGNQLNIRGRQADDLTDDGTEKVYLHRGIAARQFQRSFLIAEGIEVTGASLDNGLLNIDLARPKVEEHVKTIRIDGPARSGSETLEVSSDATDGDPATGTAGD